MFLSLIPNIKEIQARRASAFYLMNNMERGYLTTYIWTPHTLESFLGVSTTKHLWVVPYCL